MDVGEGRSVGESGAVARRERPVARLLGRARATLWGVAFLFFCVGDVATTQVGLSTPGVVEAGPVVAPVLREYGLAAMVGLKAVTLGLFYGVAGVVPEPHAVGVPLGLAIVGVLVTAWNLVVICLAVI